VNLKGTKTLLFSKNENMFHVGDPSTWYQTTWNEVLSVPDMVCQCLL